LKVTAPPALALSKVYHVEVTRSDLHLFCVCVCVCARARACMPASKNKIGGFFWRNTILLHSDLRIKCSSLFHKHNRSLFSKFSNTDLSISGVISSQTLFILFIMSNLVVSAFS